MSLARRLRPGLFLAHAFKELLAAFLRRSQLSAAVGSCLMFKAIEALVFTL